MALAAYATEYNIAQLSSNQVSLASKLVKVLTPIEEITKSISTSAASVSVIIPYVRIISKSLEPGDNDRGVQTMKTEMKSSLTRRFHNIEQNDKLSIATLLDPRFKDKFYSSPAVKTHVTSSVRALTNSSQSDQSLSVELCEPPPKRPCTEMWKMFNEILEENQNESSCYRDELDTYLVEPLVTFGRSNGLQWWSENLSKFPTLAQIAQKYLCAPPTSVPSERLFSGAGNVYVDRRSRLAPRNAEILLFIKNNIDLIK